jgi:hypothetical protein
MLGLLVLERTLGLFLLAQCLHIGWWRFRRPSNYLIWFFVAWLVVPALVIASIFVSTSWYAGDFDVENGLGWLGAFVGYGACCGAYVMLYPAMLDLSPSLELLRALNRASDRRLGAQSIQLPGVAGREAVRLRVANLQSSGLASMESSGLLRTTPKGRKIIAPLETYRRLLGVKAQEGG